MRYALSLIEIGQMFVFGGMVDDRKQLNDLFIYAADANEWRDPKPRGTVPAPRSCHTTTYVESEDKLFVYGGYGGDGRLFPDVEAFHVSTLTWAPLPTKGAVPVSRFDHTASLAGNKLIICRGASARRKSSSRGIILERAPGEVRFSEQSWPKLSTQQPELSI